MNCSVLTWYIRALAASDDADKSLKPLYGLMNDESAFSRIMPSNCSQQINITSTMFVTLSASVVTLEEPTTIK